VIKSSNKIAIKASVYIHNGNGDRLSNKKIIRPIVLIYGELS